MISVITCTGRAQPRFDVMVDSIYSNLKSIDPSNKFQWFEHIVVDMKLWENEKERRQELTDIVRGRYTYKHVPPKPSVWQGPTRLTKSDWYALNSARNTGLCYASFNHIILLDDCIVADSMWLQWHLQAARLHIALAGTYESVKNAVVEDGKVVSFEKLPPGNEDHRLSHVIDAALPVKAPGGWMYGLCNSYPLDVALSIGGYDEFYDGQGGSEDSDFGVRLERSGVSVYFSSECKIFQLLDTHDAVCDVAGFGRVVGHKEPRKPKELKLKDGKMHYANERLIEILYEQPDRYLPLQGPNLMLERQRLAEGKGFTIPVEPTRDWRDNQLLSEME